MPCNLCSMLCHGSFLPALPCLAISVHLLIVLPSVALNLIVASVVKGLQRMLRTASTMYLS